MSRAIKEITVLYGSGYNAWISTMLEIEIEKKRIICVMIDETIITINDVVVMIIMNLI